jgi:hypothetical protein
LEGEEHHIVHHLDVFLVVRRNAGRRFHGGIGRGTKALRLLNPLLDLANAEEIFVQLLFIAVRQFALQRAGVVQDKIHNRALLRLPALEIRRALTGPAGAEETLEEQSRIWLGGNWSIWRTPGEVVLVGAGIT